MNYKFAQFTQSTRKQSGSSIDAFIAQPDSYKEKLAGRVFVLLEINKANNDSKNTSNKLIDLIVQNFYQNEKLLLREKMPTLKVEHIFEASLAKTNKQFKDYLDGNKIKTKISDINVIAGLVFENELYLANSGNNHAFLVYPKNQKDKNTDEKYKIANILKQDDEDSRKIRLFTDVINGSIPKKGSIFLCNEALPEYVSQKSLCDILSQLPPLSAVEQIKNTISSINQYISFAGIVIKNTQLEFIPETQAARSQKSNDSINKLNRAESTTEELLTPSGMISIKKWLRSIPLPKGKQKTNNKTTPLFLKDKIFVKKKSILKKYLNQFLSFINNLWIAIFRIFKSINTKGLSGLKEKLSSDRLPFGISILGFGRFFKKKKVLLSVVLLISVLFVFNLKRTEDINQQVEDEGKYQEISDQIEQKQNQAEANLLYSNDEGAKRLFDEINELLEQLPKENDEQQRQYEEFKEKFDAQLEKIRRVTRVDSAQELIDLNTLSTRANAKNIIFSNQTNRLFLADQEQRSVYIYDLLEQEAVTVTDLNNPITELEFPIISNNEENDFIYYINNDNLIELNANEESLSTVDINITNPGSIAGSGIYNSNIYLLDKAENDIFRYSKNGSNFGSAIPWLNEDIDMSNASDIAIDGHIYLLKSDGNMIKLLRGSLVDFDLELCDPPLENPEKVHVSQDFDFLYILEPLKNRLLVYSKEGDFIMQYMGDNLDDLRDFAIDERQQIIYFLNNTKVLKFNAVHFN